MSDDDATIAYTVDALVEEKAVGWFQGRMEFGPRALGARSILSDPRSPVCVHLARQVNGPQGLAHGYLQGQFRSVQYAVFETPPNGSPPIST